MSFKLAIQFLTHEKSLDQNFNYDQSVAFLRKATGFFFFFFPLRKLNNLLRQYCHQGKFIGVSGSFLDRSLSEKVSK